MRHLRQVLAWDAQPIRHIEEADRDDDMAGAVITAVGHDPELRLRAADLDDALVEAYVDCLAGGHPAVILDRFLARRLVTLHGKRVSANLDQLGRGEELHPGRVADDGVDEGAFVDHQRRKAPPPGFDRAGEPDGPGADYEEIVHASSTLRRFRVPVLGSRFSDRMTTRAFSLGTQKLP